MAARPEWVRTLVGCMAALAIAATATMATADGAPAQSAAMAQYTAPTLRTMSSALRTQDYTAQQVRRFRSPEGGVVTVREQLEVKANGSTHPEFALTFLGVEGEPSGSPQMLEWQRVYSRFGSLFFTHGMFRVRDAAAAGANYTVHDFGPAVRAGRPARRLVVFPNSLDKAIWLVDVDVQTTIPLYFAEFDVQLHVLAEVEVQAFATTVAPLLASATLGGTLVADFAAAHKLMGAPAQIVDPAVTAASDYRVDSVMVQVDPLNGRQKLQMTYTDGIDQFVVVQAPGTPDVFGGLPGRSAGGHVIARFRDPAMSVLLFWESGVSFHVAGRGSLRRLDGVARDLYVQAVSSN